MQVDATRSYNEQFTNITSTGMASLCQMNRIKHLLDSRTLENVITSLVFSKLYFSSSVWANTSKTNIRKLQKIQNFAARILSGTRKYEHITPVLNDLRWLSVPASLAFYDAILTFKCLRGLTPMYLLFTGEILEIGTNLISHRSILRWPTTVTAKSFSP